MSEKYKKKKKNEATIFFECVCENSEVKSQTSVNKVKVKIINQVRYYNILHGTKIYYSNSNNKLKGPLNLAIDFFFK